VGLKVPHFCQQKGVINDVIIGDVIGFMTSQDDKGKDT